MFMRRIVENGREYLYLSGRAEDGRFVVGVDGVRVTLGPLTAGEWAMLRDLAVSVEPAEAAAGVAEEA